MPIESLQEIQPRDAGEVDQRYMPDEAEPDLIDYTILNEELRGMDEFDRYESADRLHANAVGRLKEKLDRFERVLIDHILDLKGNVEESREERNFSERYIRNKSRSNNAVTPTFLDKGGVARSQRDGHAELGISQGLSFQAITSASAHINSTFFEGMERFYQWRGTGVKPENRKVTQILNDVTQHLLRVGGFEREGSRISWGISANGNAPIRMEMYRPLKYVRNEETGEYEEDIGDLVPDFKAWPWEDVYVTDYGQPCVEDQEGVIWVTRNVTVHDLEANEANYDFTFTSDPARPIVKRRNGKYLNLKKLRDSEAKNDLPSSRDTLSLTRFGKTEAVSSFPRYDLHEHEGALPMYKWVMSGDFDWEIASTVFGVDVGMKPIEDDDESLMEYGRRLNRIRTWNTSFVVPKTENPSGVEGHLIQFEASPHAGGRKTLYHPKYYQDGEEFLGNGIIDVGYRIEDAVDLLRNASIRIVAMQANPAYLADQRLLVKKTMDEFKRLFQPNAIIPKTPGADPNQIIKAVEVSGDIRAIENVIAMLKNEHEFITGITSAIKTGQAQTQTRTATELNMQAAQSRSRLDDIVVGMSKEIYRMIKDMIHEYWDKEGKEGFIQLAIKVSGLNADEIREQIHSVDDLWEEYHLENPVTMGRNRDQLAAAITSSFAAYGGAQVFDPIKTASLALQFSGLPRPAEILIEGSESSDPDTEHDQMAQGTWIKPKMNEQIMEHIAEHRNVLQAIMSGNRAALPPNLQKLRDENLEVLAAQLEPHLRQTESNFNTMIQQQALQQQQQAMMGALLGGNANGGGAQIGMQAQQNGAMGQQASQDQTALMNGVL